MHHGNVYQPIQLVRTPMKTPYHVLILSRNQKWLVAPPHWLLQISFICLYPSYLYAWLAHCSPDLEKAGKIIFISEFLLIKSNKCSRWTSVFSKRQQRIHFPRRMLLIYCALGRWVLSKMLRGPQLWTERLQVLPLTNLIYLLNCLHYQGWWRHTLVWAFRRSVYRNIISARWTLC